jgi:hypothetical protein
VTALGERSAAAPDVTAAWLLSAAERGNPASAIDVGRADGRAWTVGNLVQVHTAADVEVLQHGRQVLRIGLQAKAGASEGGAAVAAQVVGDEPVAGVQQRLPRQRPGLQRHQPPWVSTSGRPVPAATACSCPPSPVVT